jgi:hypothetical protein
MELYFYHRDHRGGFRRIGITAQAASVLSVVKNKIHLRKLVATWVKLLGVFISAIK